MAPYRWPETREEWDAQVAAAKAKYAPVVKKLPPTELVGLMDAVRDRVGDLSAEAHAEDIRRGHRPPGTSIGGRSWATIPLRWLTATCQIFK